MTRPSCLLALLVAAPSVPAAEWHYATKADARVGHRTEGASPSLDVATLVGGENCAAATPIATLPFTDSGDTTGHASDVDTLPAPCSDFTQVAGPDLVYVFTVGAGNSVAFQVTP